MTNLTDHPTNAIGYIRVSSELQAEDDHALARQVDVLRRACKKRGLSLPSIYEDVGSAAERFSFERRTGLASATRLAKQEGAVLVVCEPTRLFRNAKEAEQWLQTFDLCIFSADDDRFLSKESFLEAVKKGEAAARNIRQGTAAALTKKQAEGNKTDTAVDRSAAWKASRRSRFLKSDSIVDSIAHVLLEDEAYRDLSHRALADLLNRRGILTGWKRPWTGDGLKRQRSKAEARIREWAEIDAEGDEVAMAAESLPDESDAEELETTRPPYFGMF